MSKTKHIGITGSDGNIGTILMNALVDQYDLRLFTQRPVDYDSVVADLSDIDQVRGIFDGLDCLIHLAAETGIFATWDSILPNNIVATHLVFAEAVRAGVKKIIFASTNHTQHGYFMRDGKPNVTDPESNRFYKLTDPPHPDSIYGVSKLFGENLGRYYVTVADIQFVALKIGWMQNDDNPAHVDGTESERHLRSLFLSRRDCIHAFERAIEVDTDYLVAYVTSKNVSRFLRVSNSPLAAGPMSI